MSEHVLGCNASPVHQREHGHDVLRQQNMGVWLGLTAFTFFYGTFIAANVYLRGWSPQKFALSQSQISNIPYYSALDLRRFGQPTCRLARYNWF